MADLKATFKLTGAKEFERMLLELGKVPAGRVGIASVRAGAQVFADKMKENIGARGLVLSGKMIESVKVTAPTGSQQVRGERVAYAGSPLFYAKFSEFGTVRQSAKPWARPAVDEGAGEAIGALGVELGAGIEREAARLQAKKGIGALHGGRRWRPGIAGAGERSIRLGP